MKPLKRHRGTAALLLRSNIDTDQIIPKQFLKKIERSGFGKHLFHDWRFMDEEGKVENSDFILNQEPFRHSSILVAGENFGCGSSREHAPWALEDFGFRVVIAPSFADIFYNNAFKNGMLPLILVQEKINEIVDFLESGNTELEVDLEKKVLTAGKIEYSFELDEIRRECLLNGWDDIGLTLRHESEINTFEKNYEKKHSYLFKK